MQSIYPDKEDSWTECMKSLPPADVPLLVIGKLYSWSENVRIVTAKFSPTMGWRGDITEVYAWKIMDEETREMMKRYHPQNVSQRSPTTQV